MFTCEFDLDVEGDDCKRTYLRRAALPFVPMAGMDISFAPKGNIFTISDSCWLNEVREFMVLLEPVADLFDEPGWELKSETKVRTVQPLTPRDRSLRICLLSPIRKPTPTV
jgi:hypothetical protein